MCTRKIFKTNDTLSLPILKTFVPSLSNVLGRISHYVKQTLQTMNRTGLHNVFNCSAIQRHENTSQGAPWWPVTLPTHPGNPPTKNGVSSKCLKEKNLGEPHLARRVFGCSCYISGSTTYPYTGRIFSCGHQHQLSQTDKISHFSSRDEKILASD